ncbi:MAG: hypothetical protein QW597_04885 [Thermoplasmataceae archaeon]
MNLPVVILAVVLITGLGIHALGPRDDGAGSVIYGNIPNINIQLPGNISYNLTYLGLIYLNQGQPSVNYFANDNWHGVDNNGNLSYSSNFTISNSGEESGHNRYGSNGQSFLVIINVTPENATPEKLFSLNSSNLGNFSEYTYYKVSVYIHFSSLTAVGPGALVILVSDFSAKNNTMNLGRDDFYGDGQMPGHPGSMVNGYFFNPGKYQALFWWNDTYNLNGGSQTLLNSTGNKYDFNFPETAINFVFNVSGMASTIYQDPYLATAGVNITTLHISSVQQSIVNFILQHEELLSVGMAMGAVLLAVPYIMYRRRKFI